MYNSNQSAIDEYLLDDIVTDNQIYAEFFIPFVILRLLSTDSDKNETLLSISLHNSGGKILYSRINLLISSLLGGK